MMRSPQYVFAMLLSACMLTPAFVSAADTVPVDGKTPAPLAKSEVVDDATITRNVIAVLKGDPQVSGQTVDVETQNGVVTVTGKINDQQHAAKVLKLAHGVKGVKDVKNMITMGNP